MKTAFGKNLRALRQRLGLTQRDLAKAINTTQATIASYENSGKYPQKEAIRNKLLEVLECSEVELYGFSDGYYAMSNVQGGCDSESKAVDVYYDHNIDLNAEIDECIIDLNTGKTFDAKPKKRYVDKQIAQNNPKGYFVQVTDDGMNKYMPKGSFAYIAPKNKVEYDNHVCAITIDGFNTIFRRISHLPYDNLIAAIPHSFDDSYSATTINPAKNDNFKILGKVVWYSNDCEGM